MGAGITGRTLASARRLAILRFLREVGEAALVTEVATATGLHHNTAREHLDRLVAAGFVERAAEHRGTQGRPRLRYALVRRRAAATADERFREAYLASAREALDLPEEASSDDAEAQEVAAQLAALDLHLDDLGFAPEVAAPERTVHLRRCPYATLAHERTELLCEVHLDLARDVLAAEGGPVTAASLEPFVGPRHCLLHLTGF